MKNSRTVLEKTKKLARFRKKMRRPAVPDMILTNSTQKKLRVGKGSSHQRSPEETISSQRGVPATRSLDLETGDKSIKFLQLSKAP